VSTSTSGTVASTDAAAATPQPTPNGDSDHCCEPSAPEVPPADTAARASRPARAPPPERFVRPPTRAVAKRVRTRDPHAAGRSADALADRDEGLTARERATRNPPEADRLLRARAALSRRRRSRACRPGARGAGAAGAGAAHADDLAAGRPTGGARDGQSPAPPAGGSVGLPLLGVFGGLVRRDKTETEEGMSARTRR
jgi:hypothetical protein